jgi:hypothetical protein
MDLVRRIVMRIMNRKRKNLMRHYSNKVHPFKRILPGILLFGVLILGSTMIGQTACAGEPDQLYVTGIIKSVNAGTGIVMVDVTSSACRGLRVFKADNLDKLVPLVEQRASFFINSSTCNVKETYTIITKRGIWK